MANVSNKNFHGDYFKKIIKLADEYKLEEAIHEYQKYIRNYPNDLCGYTFYADALIKLGRFDEAELILDSAIITDKTTNLSLEDYNGTRIKLLSAQKKYEEAYFLLQQNIEVYRRRGWFIMGPIYFLKRQLGLLNDSIDIHDNYILKQIISYQMEDALTHIQKHSSFVGNDNPVQFVEGFPLKEVYLKIRNMLSYSSTNKIYSDFISNRYIYKYNANGHVRSNLVDYIEVITLQNSSDIITMYPYENRERRAYIDITPTLDEETSKVKRMSQIEKFNQRYGKMVDNN